MAHSDKQAWWKLLLHLRQVRGMSPGAENPSKQIGHLSEGLCFGAFCGNGSDPRSGSAGSMLEGRYPSMDECLTEGTGATGATGLTDLTSLRCHRFAVGTSACAWEDKMVFFSHRAAMVLKILMSAWCWQYNMTQVSSSRSNLQNLFAVCRKTRSKTDDMKCNTYATPLKCVDKEVKPLWIRASTGHKSKKTNTTCYCEFAIVDTPNPPHHVLLVFDSSHLLNAKAL